MDIESLDFKKLRGIIPAIIIDNNTNEVLMLGFMNKDALVKTIDQNLVTFYSRTKKRLWTKGESSGNYLHVKKITDDCDNDTLLIRVEPEGPVCHTGSQSCFTGQGEDCSVTFLNKLQKVIESRKDASSEKSYTASLFEKGINKIAQKVGEEAVELVIESKDSNDNLFLNEAADLLYHMMVLLSSKGYGIQDVSDVLVKRHR